MTFLDYKHKLLTCEAKMEWQKNPTLTTGCYIIFNFVQFRICLYVYQEAKIPFNILSFYVQLLYAGQFSKVQFKRRQLFFAVALNNWAPFISTMIWKLTSRRPGLNSGQVIPRDSGYQNLIIMLNQLGQHLSWRCW